WASTAPIAPASSAAITRPTVSRPRRPGVCRNRMLTRRLSEGRGGVWTGPAGVAATATRVGGRTSVPVGETTATSRLRAYRRTVLDLVKRWVRWVFMGQDTFRTISLERTTTGRY